jgi:hypothetical protein
VITGTNHEKSGRAKEAIKLGYRWLLGDGKKIRFSGDTWFGTTLLAMQFYELYCICNEKIRTLAKVWVDGELRLSFRRTFSVEMMQIWGDLCVVMEQVSLNEDSDSLVKWGVLIPIILCSYQF